MSEGPREDHEEREKGRTIEPIEADEADDDDEGTPSEDDTFGEKFEIPAFLRKIN